MINFYKNILNLAGGKVLKCFSAWKNIPERINNEHINKCNKFERTLFKYSSKIIK